MTSTPKRGVRDTPKRGVRDTPKRGVRERKADVVGGRVGAGGVPAFSHPLFPFSLSLAGHEGFTDPHRVVRSSDHPVKFFSDREIDALQ